MILQRADSTPLTISTRPSMQLDEIIPNHTLFSQASETFCDTDRRNVLMKLRLLLTATKKVKHELANVRGLVTEALKLGTAKELLTTGGATIPKEILNQLKAQKPLADTKQVAVDINRSEEADKENSRGHVNNLVHTRSDKPNNNISIPIKSEPASTRARPSVSVPKRESIIESKISSPVKMHPVCLIPVKPQEDKLLVPSASSSSLAADTSNLRNKIYKQLEELRKIEKRETVVRNINESRVARVSVSEAKRKPTTENSDVKPITQKSVQKCHETTSVSNDQRPSSTMTFETEYSGEGEDKNMDLAVIDVAIKPTAPAKTNSLLCPAKHEYYSGATANSKPHGYGRLFHCCNKIPLSVPEGFEFYTGNFVEGKFEGYGTLTLKQGMKYVGMFKNGMKHGEGSLFLKGKVEMAKWHNDKFVSNM